MPLTSEKKRHSDLSSIWRVLRKKTPRQKFWNQFSFWYPLLLLRSLKQAFINEKNATSRILESAGRTGQKRHVENFGINFWYALLLLRNLKKAFTNEKTPRRESWNQENHQKWTFILPDRERKIYLWRGQSNQRKKVWDRIIAYLCGALDWSSFFTQERLKNPKEPVGNVYLINFQIRSSFPSSWHDI